MNKILIINSFGIGDVLFTTPIIRNLRLAYPDAFIGYIVNQRALPVVKNNPHINRVYIYDRDEFQKDLIPSWYRLYQQIHKERFDMVFDFSLNDTFGFFALACGIKRRIGYDFKGRSRFLTHKFPLKGYENQHVVQYYSDLLEKVNIPAIYQSMEMVIDANDQAWAQDWLKAQGIDTSLPVIAVIPGGGASWGNQASQKQWPLAQYSLLLDKIIAKKRAVVILMGDSKDQKLAQELTQRYSDYLYEAICKNSLMQMAALLKLCRLAVVNDGGPLHVAAAVGVKTVSLFGPVDPQVYGPFPREGHIVIQKNLPCQPCYRQFRKASCDHLSCLKDLSVQEVYEKIERFL